jgi:hypothetical protein
MKISTLLKLLIQDSKENSFFYLIKHTELKVSRPEMSGQLNNHQIPLANSMNTAITAHTAASQQF